MKLIATNPRSTHASHLDEMQWRCNLAHGCGSKPMVPFWLVGEFTTHFRTYFSGDWDVHWGYGVLTHGHMMKLAFWVPLFDSI